MTSGPTRPVGDTLQLPEYSGHPLWAGSPAFFYTWEIEAGHHRVTIEPRHSAFSGTKFWGSEDTWGTGTGREGLSSGMAKVGMEGGLVSGSVTEWRPPAA